MSEAVQLTGKLIIGLTGNIATGKSAVMRLAAERDALTIDADKVVHHIMDTDAEMQAGLAVAFGSGVRRENGRIDRRALGAIVFNDPDALADLEAMVHPAVRRHVVQRIQESDADIIMIEAIKLLEGGLVEMCDQVWVTRCDPQRQLDRLRICRGLETNDAAHRIKMQPPQAEKVARADVVIDTNGSMRDTEAQFGMMWQRLPLPADVPDKTIVLPPKMTEMLGKQAKKGESETAVAPTKDGPSILYRPDGEQPEGLEVRRAKPSDIPGLLLLIQRATDGAVKMKRAELLMALSERGYFIGQVGADISTVMGFRIDSQIARVDELYVYPEEMIGVTTTAVLAEIERSAFAHMCQIILTFLPEDAPAALHQIFTDAGYTTEPIDKLARNWRDAITESQPENTTWQIKILMDTRAT